MAVQAGSTELHPEGIDRGRQSPAANGVFNGILRVVQINVPIKEYTAQSHRLVGRPTACTYIVEFGIVGFGEPPIPVHLPVCSGHYMERSPRPQPGPDRIALRRGGARVRDDCAGKLPRGLAWTTMGALPSSS